LILRSHGIGDFFSLATDAKNAKTIIMLFEIALMGCGLFWILENRIIRALRRAQSGQSHQHGHDGLDPFPLG
jgi:hypothetical protein